MIDHFTGLVQQEIGRKDSMTLLEKQQKFTAMLAILIQWINGNEGYSCKVLEVSRPQVLQDIYLKTGKTKTKNSAHLYDLAGDIGISKDGIFLTESTDYKFAGDYWKTLDPENIWGGDWGWDGNHFQYTQV
jgi:hypothetical protein